MPAIEVYKNVDPTSIAFSDITKENSIYLARPAPNMYIQTPVVSIASDVASSVTLSIPARLASWISGVESSIVNHALANSKALFKRSLDADLIRGAFKPSIGAAAAAPACDWTIGVHPDVSVFDHARETMQRSAARAGMNVSTIVMLHSVRFTRRSFYCKWLLRSIRLQQPAAYRFLDSPRATGDAEDDDEDDFTLMTTDEDSGEPLSDAPVSAAMEECDDEDYAPEDDGITDDECQMDHQEMMSVPQFMGEEADDGGEAAAETDADAKDGMTEATAEATSDDQEEMDDGILMSDASSSVMDEPESKDRDQQQQEIEEDTPLSVEEQQPGEDPEAPDVTPSPMMMPPRKEEQSDDLASPLLMTDACDRDAVCVPMEQEREQEEETPAAMTDSDMATPQDAAPEMTTVEVEEEQTGPIVISIKDEPSPN